jgi:hypothetical protein
MNLFKLIFHKSSLKRKILDIKDAINDLVALYNIGHYWVEWYGAYDVDPKHLAFWICVSTDDIKYTLQENTVLNEKLRNLLERYDYPHQARSSVYIGFESQQTVDREAGGNWRTHFQ